MQLLTFQHVYPPVLKQFLNFKPPLCVILPPHQPTLLSLATHMQIKFKSLTDSETQASLVAHTHLGMNNSVS
jgi:hypothetical protein